MPVDRETEDDSARLLPVVHRNFISGVGVPSTVLEPPNEYKNRWRSIRIMYVTMFLSSIGFSICISSIWPFLMVLDKTADASFLGWVVAGYSLGQLIASPIFGWWSNLRKNSKNPLIVSVSITAAANIMYAYSESSPFEKGYYLLLSRFCIGVGAGNVAVVRSYISGCTTIKERTAAMANISAFQAVGFVLGPAVQAALVPIGYPGPVASTAFTLNLYTAPAFMSAIFSFLNLALLFAVFREHHVYDDQMYNASGHMTYSPDYTAVFATIIFFFAILFIFAVFETIGTPLSMDMYDWTKEEATLYNGILLAGAGFISILVFISVKALSKRVNERYLFLGGLVICLAAFITYLPWGDDFPDLRIATIGPPIENVTSTLTTTLPVNSTTAEYPAARGCPMMYDWCYYTPIVSLPQFILGAAMIAVGYPTCNVMAYTLYSKILGPRPQGLWMGWLTATGSGARTLGPVFVSQVYTNFGPRAAFGTMCVLIFITICGVILAFKRLLPFSFQELRHRTETVSTQSNSSTPVSRSRTCTDDSIRWLMDH